MGRAGAAVPPVAGIGGVGVRGHGGVGNARAGVLGMLDKLEWMLLGALEQLAAPPREEDADGEVGLSIDILIRRRDRLLKEFNDVGRRCCVFPSLCGLQIVHGIVSSIDCPIYPCVSLLTRHVD